MTVLKTNISWCDSTWNPWLGCHKVSAGCDNCYAEEFITRLGTLGIFEQVAIKLEARMKDLRKFTPIESPDGLLPRRIFVNSMSDFFVEDVPDAIIHLVLDTMEANPRIVWMILTKRQIRARRLLVERYAGKNVPKHIWIGVSAEDNRVAKRLDIMRTVKMRCGGGVFFTSVEPIIANTDQLDFTDFDLVITGGESGPRARLMERPWLMAAIESTLKLGVPLFHKQNGAVASHPNLDRVPHRFTKPADQFRWLRDNGWETIPTEKGGATVDRMTYREMPAVYYEIKQSMA